MRSPTAPPPSARRPINVRSALVWLALGLALIGLRPTLGLRAAALLADEPTLRLRIAWGGGTEKLWHGTLALENGALADPQPLGIEADEPGSMWIDQAGALVVAARSSRAYDGVDIEVRADLTSHLLVSLAPAGDPLPEPIRIELSRLVSELHKSTLDQQNNLLLVRRTPGDKLRVAVLSPSLVFAPGERMRLRLQPHLLGADVVGPISIKAQILVGRGKRQLSTSQQQLDLSPAGQPDAALPLELPVPQEEGVYDLLLSASRTAGAEGLLPLGKRAEVLSERKVQFIVVDSKQPPEETVAAPSSELMAIGPAKTWWDRVSHLPKIPGLDKEPLEHGKVGPWEHPLLGPMVSLAPGGTGDDEAWVAYPLAVSQPGQVHIVEVEYPSDVPQAMSISIVEPNAAGMVIPTGLDSGIHVSPQAAVASPTIERHRLVFWPRTKEPLLLIAQAGGGTRAVHGRIRLLGPRKFGVGALRLGAEPRVGLPRMIALEPAERLAAGYMERPSFPENFGATEVLDAWSGRSLDDWTTFYEGATRLLEYADHIGYNALVVAVMTDGSTIYPSRHLDPTPRFDTGAWFSTAQDPVRKDVLEMLFRLADRDGQSLIPLVQFSSPLPELEHQLRGDGADPTGIALVGLGGTTWTQRHGSDRGLAAYYNPLDPRVQQAMQRVVHELLERYGHHRSFAGVALGSSSPGYALLPGINWGLDDATTARFARETGRELPTAGGPERFAQRARLLGGDHREAWLAWRADALHRFHVALRDDVAAAHPGARLLVATDAMLESPDVEPLLRPALPGRYRIGELPGAVGLRPELYRGDEGIVLLRPHLVAAPPALRAQAVSLVANDAPELDRAFEALSARGDLFVQASQKLRLSSFDRQSPFGADRTYTALMPQLAPGGAESRRRFVRAVAALDAPLLVDGGSMLTLGAEESISPLLATYRRLPIGMEQILAREAQGLIVRALSRDSSTYLCVINPLPWKCRLGVSAAGAESAALTELSGRRQVAPMAGGRLTLDLEPYDLLALRLSAPGANFSNCEVQFEDRARDRLREQIAGLVARAAALAEPMRIPVLTNPDFELPRQDADEIPGWVVVGAQGSTGTLDAGQPHGGNLAARLVSTSGVGSLISNPFDAPRSGRISYSVWLRSAAGAPPPLRLAIGGKLGGVEYYRYTGDFQVTPQWKHFLFQVDDLPLAGLSELRVRFDLMGPGQVSIDDLVVSDLTFSPNERTELSRIITRAQFSLEDGRLAECAQLLEGYWPWFLQENVPTPKANIATSPPPGPATAPPTPVTAPAEAALPWWRRGLPGIFK